GIVMDRPYDALTNNRSAEADPTRRSRRVRFSGPVFRSWLTPAWLVVLPLLSIACRPDRVQPTGYYGPTESMAEVVQQINQNNRSIPTLWSRHDFEADIVDEDGRNHFVNGDGLLLYRKPHELRLIGEKPIVGQ